MTESDIKTYNDKQSGVTRDICTMLRGEIDRVLGDAESKIWHGAPVWFIDGNPIVGYWVRKNNVQLLFWSGQSFDEPELKPEGSFKAAEVRIKTVKQIKSDELWRWLEKSKRIQWNYKNIVKNKGVLERLK